MNTVVVVGSGASGVHFAWGVLRKGYRVVMLDVGHRKFDPVNPGDSFQALKRTLDDPAAYFLGSQFESLILPDYNAEYYGFPPSKSYVFQPRPEFQYEARGFSPLISFAAGGLAEAWTGGCYPFNDAELQAFPFGYRELAPFYGEVARRIGMSGTADDLSAFLPLHDGLQEPLQLDEHSALLLRTYGERREYLNRKLRWFAGRARLATLSRDQNGRKACSYSGRCLWGCASESLYTPSVTLRECRAHPNFEYLDGWYADHFRFNAGGRVHSIVARDSRGEEREFTSPRLALAAGTLSSARIFLESVYRDSGEVLQLRGLMDNRQVLMPFLNLRMTGHPFNPNTYQYHQIAIGLEREQPADYVHGLVTTLKTALIHPVVQTLPVDLGTAVSMFRKIHAALGLVNINFPDDRRDDNYVTLEVSAKSRPLVIRYRPSEGEPARLKEVSRIFRKALWKLGCVAPPPLTHLRPMGASVHYAGTLPMSDSPAPLTCSPECRSHDFENLYFVDGTTFPFLPAKNLTFTLMANAARVAEQAF